MDDFLFDVGDKIEESIKGSALVYCTRGSGMFGASKSDETKLMVKLFKLIVDDKKSTTRQELFELIDQLNAIRFNRKLVNKQLNELKSGHL